MIEFIRALNAIDEFLNNETDNSEEKVTTEYEELKKENEYLKQKVCELSNLNMAKNKTIRDLQKDIDLYSQHVCNCKSKKSAEPTTVSATDDNKILREIKQVMCSGPAVIVFWKDGTKTKAVFKEHADLKFDKYTGFLICVLKKYYNTLSIMNAMEMVGALKVETPKKDGITKKATNATKAKKATTVRKGKGKVENGEKKKTSNN